jgi:excinuclease UvrABC nuclease subunit
MTKEKIEQQKKIAQKISELKAKYYQVEYIGTQEKADAINLIIRMEKAYQELFN